MTDALPRIMRYVVDGVFAGAPRIDRFRRSLEGGGSFFVTGDRRS